MNDKDLPFEDRFSRVPQRPIPPSWRGEILRAAAEPATRPADAHPHWKDFLVDLFWPHPKAWGALAAVWVLILGLNFANREPAETVLAREPEVLSPQMRELLQRQQQLFAEIVGTPPPEAIPPRSIPGQPRSQRRQEFGYA